MLGAILAISLGFPTDADWWSVWREIDLDPRRIPIHIDMVTPRCPWELSASCG